MTERYSNKSLKIRPATVEDIDALADLNTQLGYPTLKEQLSLRFHRLQSWQEHAVFVATLEDGRVAGWIHVFLQPLLISELGATIGGLVVDDSSRRLGIGERLMNHAEQWARERGCEVFWLRSGEARKDAHAFYTAMGYTFTKNSQTFEKKL
ncbi:MAG: GNAT family N-acetyltransferase [Anaerolineales bacterium]|nr:GNAT family N-acetyltransferase [Anaerolineales bacterium]